MSTAEAVAVAHAAALDAHYFGDGTLAPEHLVRQMLGTALKDNPEDAKKLRHYMDVVVKARSTKHRAVVAIPRCAQVAGPVTGSQSIAAQLAAVQARADHAAGAVFSSASS